MNRGDSALRASRPRSSCSSCRLSAVTMWHVSGIEGGGDLRIEVDPVDDDYDGWVTKLFVLSGLLW